MTVKKKKLLEIERGRTRSYVVDISVWKGCGSVVRQTMWCWGAVRLCTRPCWSNVRRQNYGKRHETCQASYEILSEVTSTLQCRSQKLIRPVEPVKTRLASIPLFVTFGVTLPLYCPYLICVISTEGQPNIQNVVQSSVMCFIRNAAFRTRHGRSGALLTYNVREPNLYIHFKLKILFAPSYFIGRRNIRHWIEPANTSKGLLAPANNSDNRWPSHEGVCEMKSLVRYFVSVTFCMPSCPSPPLPFRRPDPAQSKLSCQGNRTEAVGVGNLREAVMSFSVRALSSGQLMDIQRTDAKPRWILRE